jgi:hypothetical protein
MFEFQLTEEASITLEYEQQLAIRPRLSLSRLCVILSVSNSSYELDREELDIIGSKEDWLRINDADTLGFDANSHLLKLISLSYPESNKVPESLHFLKDAERVIGLPKLVKYPKEFQLRKFPYRYYHLEGNVLLCFNDLFSCADKLTEISISKDLSLFFTNNRYCGWGLYHPERFIVMRIDKEIDYPSDPIVKESLRDVFDLMADEKLELIVEEHDEYYLEQLAILHNRIVSYGAPPNSPLASLADWLFYIADSFYKQEQVSRLFVR